MFFSLSIETFVRQSLLLIAPINELIFNFLINLHFNKIFAIFTKSVKLSASY